MPCQNSRVPQPPSGGASCRLQAAAYSPVTADALAGKGADPALSARRRFPGANDSPELASSLVLRLPASWPYSLWGALASPPDVVLRLSAGTNGFFFLRDRAILSSLRMAGESCRVEIVLKASSSCLSTKLLQELIYTTQDTL